MKGVEIQDPRVEIREAAHEDVPAVVEGLTELLVEIGGSPAPAEQLEEAARELIDDPDAGCILVAVVQGRIVGVLGVSWQSAIRIPGPYGLIQELWVTPTFRHLEIGTHLLNELAEVALERGVARLEVGLPSERYRHLAATASFYETNLFKGIGLRMRRVL
ncbi:MAG TPA: GNAT family N-acetyltransferase [Solirubrobacteraceae bacterium]|nr:GNAT family N-acetyltransferase [Solirubrobacteraceae bacterium]